MTRIYLSPPHMTGAERKLVEDAFDSNWIAPLGPHVTGFEAEMCEKLGVGHACALSSGTGGLHLALMMLDADRNHEVYCSTLTFAASANAIYYVGGVFNFIDSDRASWNMDPALLAQELEDANRENRLPGAVIVVDLYGQCADYDPILAACARYEIPVIEDAAEALGATYKGRHAGRFGEMGALSFNGNKIITTGGGRSPARAARLRRGFGGARLRAGARSARGSARGGGCRAETGYPERKRVPVRTEPNREPGQDLPGLG